MESLKTLLTSLKNFELYEKAFPFHLGRSWGAVTTEGLLIFSLDGSMSFQPDELTIDVTPAKIAQLSKESNHSLALDYAFKLNEKEHLERVVENIPIEDGEKSDYSKLSVRPH